MVLITPYVLISILGVAIAFTIARVAWKQRAVPGAVSLTLMMLAAGEYGLGAALELAAVGIPAKIFWSKVQHVGTLCIPVFLLIFTLEYNQIESWLTRRRLAALFIVPVITLGLLATNEWHSLFWTSFTPSTAGNNLIIYGHGIWFWIGAIGYSYLIALSATVLLIWAAIRFPRAYRHRTWTLLAGIALTWLSSLIYLLQLNPSPGLDLMPMTFAISGAIFATDIFYFRLFEIIPIARDAAMESMRDGILVLDDRERIVDINPAARRLLDIAPHSKLGQPVATILSSWQELVQHIQRHEESRAEITVQTTAPRNLDLTISILHNQRGRFTGQMLVMRDITDLKYMQQELEQANERLQVQLLEIESLHDSLREQAIRDQLTGLFNRRYLDEMLERELTRATREHTSVSIVMIDIDHFKAFNDKHGHRAGDQILHALGELLLKEIRQSDIACRYGGEEFVVVMPGILPGNAYQRAEQWRSHFENVHINYDSQFLHSTISGGVAAFPNHGLTVDEVLPAADKAL